MSSMFEKNIDMRDSSEPFSKELSEINSPIMEIPHKPQKKSGKLLV
jgi:hypothetical protein